ncbi:MAG: hypothetical protein IKP95_08595 [Ruminococcus sp.]|nr:hypothetical protein [Ruminococcus sp.]
MKLYSNEENKRLIASMIAKGREPHSVVITGERGSGRKALARYYAQALFCESGTGIPCGKCRRCRMTEHGNNPDLITLEANENGNYMLDSVRAMVSDAVIKPNEGSYKVYIIPDFDRSVNTAVQVQNVLLKLIEEPPPHCVVILTSVTKEIFLQTIISRVICFGTERCTRHQAEEWLTLQGRFEQDDIIHAVGCCGGNFGRCLEFLEGKELPAAYEIARSACDALIKGSEYELLKAFTAADGKKPILRQALLFLAETVRTAALLCIGAPHEPCCYEKGAEQLSKGWQSDTADRAYQLLTDAVMRLDANCSQSLTVNNLTGQLIKAKQ